MATNPSTLPENAGRITAPDANYPYGSAKNDTTGTTGDGTPIRKPLMDDTYGFYQALLTRAGITPSGNAETALVSQLADAVAGIGGRLDTVRIDVASAANIDLGTLAPDTRHINITGTTAVTGFTVEAGRCYFVRFDDALTLTNGASLVTQSGANILTAAGDTCIIRATADDVVEVMVYVDATVQSLTTNGLRKFKDGLVVQWITAVHTAGKNVAQVFALPDAFPNAALAAAVLDFSTVSSRPVVWSHDLLTASSVSLHWTFGDVSSATVTRSVTVLVLGH